MGYLTKWGGMWGAIPHTTGQVFWVAPAASYTIEGRTYSATNDNDGLSPERAFVTLAYAVLATRSNPAASGDVIMMLPGAHSYATTVTVTTAGLIISGVPGNQRHSVSRMPAGSMRMNSRIANTTAATAILTISATDVEVCYLHFAPPAGGGQGIALTSTAGTTNASRPYIHDCSFAIAATASVTSYGIATAAGVTADLIEDVMVSRCYFVSGTATTSGANGAAVTLLSTAHGVTIEQSTFRLKGTAAWAAAILSSSPGTLGLTIRECDFIAPTSATTVITNVITCTSMTVDASTTVLRCYFTTGSTKQVTGTATPDIACAENYVADATGGLLTAK